MELSPFDYEGYRFANERMHALMNDGDPRGEMRNVQSMIEGIVENYAEAVVLYPTPGNTLVVNAQNAKIFTHALETYNIGGAFKSVRFVFDADFPGSEIRGTSASSHPESGHCPPRNGTPTSGFRHSDAKVKANALELDGVDPAVTQMPHKMTVFFLFESLLLGR
jgi:hypothetical protein